MMNMFTSYTATQTAERSNVYNLLTAVTVRVILGLFLAAAFLPGRVYAQEKNNHIFLPAIQASHNALTHASNGPAHASDDTNGCTLNTQEQALADLMRNAPGQQRPELNCNSALSLVARAMAQDMADRDYFNAVNPEGYGPNYLVAQAGYSLPSYYGQAVDANNIAYISAGHMTAQAMWDDATGIPQMLGDNAFYAQQTDFGIGYVMASQASTYRHYWVLITSAPGE